MIKFPKLFFIPHIYENLLEDAVARFVPLIVIVICFASFYLPIGFLPSSMPADVPAVCLFCLFFIPKRLWNISAFFVIASFFEYQNYVPAGMSLLFYGILSLLAYSIFVRRQGASYNYMTLGIAFATIYGVTLFIYKYLVYGIYNADISFNVMCAAWLSVMLIYPFCLYGLYYPLLRQRHKAVHV